MQARVSVWGPSAGSVWGGPKWRVTTKFDASFF